MFEVIEKTEGPKIVYKVTDNKIAFNDEIMLNLEKYERDYENHIDICRDAFGGLVCGVVDGAKTYIAQVDIPGREYSYREDGVDENEEPKIVKEPVAFNIDNCILTLWGMEE